VDKGNSSADAKQNIVPVLLFAFLASIIACSVVYYFFNCLPKANLNKAREHASKICYDAAEEMNLDPDYTGLKPTIFGKMSLEELEQFWKEDQEKCIKQLLKEWGYIK